MTNNSDGTALTRLPQLAAAPDRSTSEHMKAQRRRAGLKRLMDRTGLTPTDIARLCDMPTPNALYNFLNGHSFGLSQDIIERILMRCPGATFEELSGIRFPSTTTTTPPQPPVESRWPCVNIAYEACLGAWTMIGAADSSQALSVPSFELGAEIFGVFVKSPGAERFYHDGSVLICRPASAWRGRPPSGSHVVLRRDRRGLFEITVRELTHDDDEATFWPASDRREAGKPIHTTLPLFDRIHERRDERLNLLGVVVAAWTIQSAAFAFFDRRPRRHRPVGAFVVGVQFFDFYPYGAGGR